MSVEVLLRSLLPGGVVVLLRNAAGSMELRGDDLALRTSESWLTIYHSDTERAGGSESRSHLHLRRGAFRVARVVEQDGRTPILEFWTHPEDAERDGRPPLTVIFPSFYDWQNGKAPIPENHEWFRNWIENNGRCFTLRDS